MTSSSSSRAPRGWVRAKAFRVITRLTVKDLLAALTVDRIVEKHADDPDLWHLTRHQFYSHEGYGERGRDALIDDLVADATADERPVTTETVEAISKLLEALRQRRPGALARVKFVAANNVRS